MNNVIIECNNLTKSYNASKIFENANVKFYKGITGLVAPNGYGKTTFIEMCSGLRKNFSGKILIYEKSPDNAKSHIGFLMDKPAYPRTITVLDYIEYVSMIYKTRYSDEILKMLLGNVTHKKIYELSAGYIKRLAFFIAVMHMPDVVFADEPFSNDVS